MSTVIIGLVLSNTESQLASILTDIERLNLALETERKENVERMVEQAYLYTAPLSNHAYNSFFNFANTKLQQVDNCISYKQRFHSEFDKLFETLNKYNTTLIEYTDAINKNKFRATRILNADFINKKNTSASS